MKSILLLIALVLSACASDKADIPSRQGNSGSLTSYARSLIGAPYKYGGNSPDSGFDCSGFVGHVFRHSAGIRLPRSTGAISRTGKPVGMNDLRAGDLVFFDTLQRKFSHVGIYLGHDRFIHAPSNGGRVRVEYMLDDYWRRNYNGARRITLLR